MRILIISLMFITSLFSVERMENLNLKINNDEFIYKERLINQELFGKKFKKIVGVKSYFLYNEFIVEDTLLNITIVYKNTNGNMVPKKIQFIIKKNSKGAPSIYKFIEPIELDSIIKEKFDKIKELNCDISNSDKENCYFIPKHMNSSSYAKVVNFLKDSYNFKLRLEINNTRLIKEVLNTQKLYILLDENNEPDISTIDFMGGVGDAKLLFDFKKGLVLSKSKMFKRSDGLKDDINRITIIQNNFVKPKYTPSLFLQIIEEEDVFNIDIKDKNGVNKKVKIKDFYFIKLKLKLKK